MQLHAEQQVHRRRLRHHRRRYQQRHLVHCATRLCDALVHQEQVHADDHRGLAPLTPKEKQTFLGFTVRLCNGNSKHQMLCRPSLFDRIQDRSLGVLCFEAPHIHFSLTCSHMYEYSLASPFFSSDVCLSAPCQHQGTCTSSGSNSYTCSCRPNFSGDQCEIIAGGRLLQKIQGWGRQ